jgi:hypothetical protein
MPPPQPPYVSLMQQLIAELVAMRQEMAKSTAELVAMRQEMAKSTAELAKLVEIAHGPYGGLK